MDLQERANNLRNEIVALRSEMLLMKVFMKEQNTMIKDLIERRQRSFKVNPENDILGFDARVYFPISTQADLDKLENLIDDTNTPALVKEVRLILGAGGLCKRLPEVISRDLILQYNVDGLIHKKRLLDYPNVLGIIQKASEEQNWDNDTFLDVLRDALQRAKKQHFQQVCKLRKQERMMAAKEENPDDNSMDISQESQEEKSPVNDETAMSENDETQENGLPIASRKALDAYEKSVTDENIGEKIVEMRIALDGKPLSKGLTEILTEDMIFDYNVDGIHNKGRLLDYTQFMGILYEAGRQKEWNKDIFTEELRTGLRLVKKRELKNRAVTRSKAKKRRSY